MTANFRERLKQVPGLARLVRWVRNKTGHRRRVFTRIYEGNLWGDRHSRSGLGSGLRATERIRRHLSALLEEFGVKSVLDIPCGDFFWMREVDLGNVDYVGADIVAEMIARNREQFGETRRQFLVLDLVRDSLPRADLVLCRDCLVHLPLGDIEEALESFKRSGSEYLLTTHYPTCAENEDISVGNWRELNLTAPPLDLPQPISMLNDESGSGEDAGKRLGLWRVADIP